MIIVTFIEQLIQQYGLVNRVIYMHDQPLADLFHYIDAVVTVNSTIDYRHYIIINRSNVWVKPSIICQGYVIKIV